MLFILIFFFLFFFRYAMLWPKIHDNEKYFIQLILYMEKSGQDIQLNIQLIFRQNISFSSNNNNSS